MIKERLGSGSLNVYLPTEDPLGVMSSGGRGDLRSTLRILEELEVSVLVVVVVAVAVKTRAGNFVEVSFGGYTMIVSSWLSDTTTEIWDKTHQNL